MCVLPQAPAVNPSQPQPHAATSPELELELARPWAQRTNRLTHQLQTLAVALGGRPAAALAHKLGLRSSRSTQLRVLMNLPLPTHPTPRVVGVDDFAFRKGHTYGTLLVDLEKRQVIELLKDRSAATFEEWLKLHPGIEVISRDRATAYARAATNVCPKAVQVADRFHLLHNLVDHLQKLAQRKKVWRYNQEPEPEPEAIAPATTTAPPASRRLTRPQQLAAQSYAQRRERYEQVKALAEEGLSNRQISRELGLNRATVGRYVTAGGPQVVESRPRPHRPSKVEPYHDYLWQRWTTEQPTIKELHAELVKQGYEGSIGPIRAWLAALRPLPYWRGRPNRGAGTDAQAALPTADPQHQAEFNPPIIAPVKYENKLSSQQAAWLLFKRERLITLKGRQRVVEALSATKKEQLGALVEWDAEIAKSYELTQQFRRLVSEGIKESDELGEWLAQAHSSGVKELVSFARGIESDRAAVEAGLQQEYSNGQLEGQVNRLKNVKRQMYGRAGFELLRHRMLVYQAA